MCGISGIIARAPQPDNLARMQSILRHRGPDGQGDWAATIQNWWVGFAHNRLAILDLHPRGQQPMHDESSGLTIVFNGEIFNYVEIRSELESKGESFQTTTDTEVLLKAFKHWPIDSVLNRCVGMFAFALLDRQQRRVVFARDRFGVKPLYIHMDPEQLVFASEIKSILQNQDRRWQPNNKVVHRYASQFLLEAEQTETFFKDIWKLPAAHYAVVDLTAQKLEWRPKRYYDLNHDKNETAVSFEDSARQVRDLLHESLKIRLRSDVPIGILLSGGLDSSALAAVGRRFQETNLRFFSVTSSDPATNEEPFIDMVAAHLRVPVEKVNVEVEAEKIWELLPETLWSNDEPITSLAAVAYGLMLKRAKAAGITVLLTGQGGDEVFCGYKKYVGFVTREAVRQGHWGKGLKVLTDFVRNGSIVNDLPLTELKRYLPGLVKKFDVFGPALSAFEGLNLNLGTGSVRDRQIADLTTFSVPALLHYEDRLSMASSCEVREPYLDHRLVEFGLKLPSSHKVSGGWTKRVLREAVKDLLPPEVTYRKDKKGFSIPQEKWLKGDLRGKVDELLLDPQSFIFKWGYFKPKQTQDLWREFQRGRRGIGYKDVLSPVLLELWCRRFEKYLAAPSHDHY